MFIEQVPGSNAIFLRHCSMKLWHQPDKADRCISTTHSSSSCYSFSSAAAAGIN